MKRVLIHCLAAALLVAASMAIWHWRFVVDPGALPETRLATPLVGWTSPPNQTHQIIQQDNEPVLVLERLDAKDKHAGIHVWFDQLEHVKFVHIRCCYRWQDVTPGQQTYMNARFVSVMKDFTGKTSHPEGGFQVFGGLGSSDWKKGEVVQKLTSDMISYGLGIAMLGKSGRLEVRDLSVSAVRQRHWVPAATCLVVIGWMILCCRLIRRGSNFPGMKKSIAGALVLVAAGWVLVFPQTNNFLLPIPHNFEVGEVNPPNKTVKVEAATSKTSTIPEALPTEPPAPKPTAEEKASSTPSKTPSTQTPVETRSSGALYHLLYQVDQSFAAAHLVLFLGLTMLVLIVTGDSSQWPLPLALAFLSEIVPELIDHLGGWDDWVDLLSNIAGVGIAVFLWIRLPFMKRFHAKPQTAITPSADP